jgi:hypothetical protein
MKNIDNLDFIIFAIRQEKEAEVFGFKRNECCRNLKLALHHYWQNKELGLHGISQKHNIRRSEAAKSKPINECDVEHAVPLMWFVDKLMTMNPPTKIRVRNLLRKYFHVLLVTKDEHLELNRSRLRSKMPQDWDGQDPWARYKEVGIKPIKQN